MLKKQLFIEIDKGANKYTFIMPSEPHLGEAYDAAFQILKEITELAYQATQSAKPRELQEQN